MYSTWKDLDIIDDIPKFTRKQRALEKRRKREKAKKKNPLEIFDKITSEEDAIIKEALNEKDVMIDPETYELVVEHCPELTGEAIEDFMFNKCIRGEDATLQYVG